MYLKLTFYLSLLFFLRCTADLKIPQAGFDASGVVEFEIDNSNKQITSEIPIEAEVKIVVINKELTLEVGSYFDGVFPLEQGILLRDKRASSLSFINYQGQLQWHVIPPSPGVDRYSTMGVVEINLYEKQIEVFDEDRQVFDHFSLEGNYLESYAPPMGFFDYVSLDSGKKVYDIEAIPVEGYFTGASGYYKFLVSGQTNELVEQNLDPVSEDVIPMVDLNRFKKVGRNIQHRSLLGNMVYYINNNGKPVEKATFNFTVKNNFYEVGSDNSIKNKGMFLFEKDMALPMHFVYDESEKRAYSIFREGRDAYFVVFENGAQQNEPARFYNIGGFMVKAPSQFENGFFIGQMYKYEFDYLQSVDFNDIKSIQSIENDLSTAQREIGDDSDVVLIMIRFK